METKIPDQVAEWMKDEVFVKRVENAANYEEVVAAFKEKGFETTSEDIKEAIQHLSLGKEEELDEDDLEAVQGGSILLGLAIIGAGALATYLYLQWVKNYLKKKGILPDGGK